MRIITYTRRVLETYSEYSIASDEGSISDEDAQGVSTYYFERDFYPVYTTTTQSNPSLSSLSEQPGIQMVGSQHDLGMLPGGNIPPLGRPTLTSPPPNAATTNEDLQ